MNRRTIKFVFVSLLVHLQFLTAFGQENPMLATMKIDVPERAILGLPIMIRVEIVADGEDARDLEFYLKYAQPELPGPPKEIHLLPGEDIIDYYQRTGNYDTEGYKRPVDEARMADLRAKGEANLVNMPIWSLMGSRFPFVINGQELSVPGILNMGEQNDSALASDHGEARFLKDFGRTKFGNDYRNLYNGESFSNYFFLSNASELYESLELGTNAVGLELDFMRYVWNEERVVVEKTFTLGRQFSVHAVDLNAEDRKLLVEAFGGEIPSHFREWAGEKLDAIGLRESLSEPTMQAVAFGLFLSELAKADPDSDLLFDLLARFPPYQYELRLKLEYELFYRAANKEACQLLARKMLDEHKGLIRWIAQLSAGYGILRGVVEQKRHKFVGSLKIDGIPSGSIASELEAEEVVSDAETSLEPVDSTGSEKVNVDPQQAEKSYFLFWLLPVVVLTVLAIVYWVRKK